MNATTNLSNAGLSVSGEFAPLMERLDSVGHVFREHGDKCEEQGDLTPEVVQTLHDVGAFKVGIPRELGGYEFSPRQVMETVARIAYEDASTAWALMALQMITAATAAYLGPAATDELFPDVASGRHALVAGQGTKPGRAIRGNGGYRITGRWHFASGISLATHVHTAAVCAETGEGLILTLPKEQVTFIENWDVMGLRATRSIDYECEDVFVPDTHVHDIATMTNRHGGAIYRLGLANMAAIGHAGWALGVGRRMLDDMRELAGKKTGSPNASVDTHQFYAEYADGESRLRSAWAWAMDVWGKNEEQLDRGSLLTTEQETLTRLMLNNATWSAESVGLMVYQWAGTAALRRGPLQRFFRDLHAGTQHITSSSVVLQSCGKQLAGLAPGSYWNFLSLQEQE